MARKSRIYQIYFELLKKHGPPVALWSQWCAPKKDKKLKEIIVLGAILTQRTSWRNAHLALLNLKKENLLSLEKIAGLKDLGRLRELIRSAGFFQTKPKRLFEFASFVVSQYGSLEKLGKKSLKQAREELLGLYGIGPETADVILLFCLGKPSFVIDEYTKRLVKKEGLAEKFDYDYLKNIFEKNLPKKVAVYQNYHALIIIEQRGRKAAKMEVV
ncbi:endonuclease III domain-containing protein [Patescibacteria group bacterium]